MISFFNSGRMSILDWAEGNVNGPVRSLVCIFTILPILQAHYIVPLSWMVSHKCLEEKFLLVDGQGNSIIMELKV